MKAMGETLDRGMVLVMSLWDDIAFQMNWLDSCDSRASDPSARVGGDQRVLHPRRQKNEHANTETADARPKKFSLVIVTLSRRKVA